MKTFCFLLKNKSLINAEDKERRPQFSVSREKISALLWLVLILTNSDSILLEDENSQGNQGTTVVTFTDP